MSVPDADILDEIQAEHTGLTDRIEALVGELKAVRAERDGLRAVARELLGFIEHGQIDLIGPKQLAAMAKRAGLVNPAITGAGTEHVARQLLDERDPRGPRWQRVAELDR